MMGSKLSGYVCSGRSSFSYTEIGRGKSTQNENSEHYNIQFWNFVFYLFLYTIIVFAIFLAQIHSLFLHFY
jgi:hypothetical protein